ncbi:unnamed protein product [Phytomonas sp. EM1]|nr:unnamed protein product [Phytomonas sp. EM1]|eukprot:CCW62656.1 unnamed protein product [Phytomonas sp. isolate EM1]
MDTSGTEVLNFSRNWRIENHPASPQNVLTTIVCNEAPIALSKMVLITYVVVCSWIFMSSVGISFYLKRKKFHMINCILCPNLPFLFIHNGHCLTPFVLPIPYISLREIMGTVSRPRGMRPKWHKKRLKRLKLRRRRMRQRSK